MAKMTTNTDSQLELSVVIAGSGDKSYLLETASSYLANDIKFKTSVPAVGAATLGITDNATDVTVGTAADGKYPLTNSLTGTMSFASAGWIGAAGASATDGTVQVGKIAQSSLANGSTAINSGATVNPTASTQTINIAAGYEAARTVKVGPVSAGPKATVTSGTASLGALTFTYNSTNSNFDISGTATITAPSVGTEGFIGTSATASVGGTKNGNSNTVTQTVGKITVGTEIASGSSGTVTPVISRTAKPSGDSWTDAASGEATGTKPSSGVYVQVDAPAVSKTLSVQGKVTVAGYGTADYHTKAAAQSITAGSAAAATKYIPIKNAATPSITTTNISGTDAVTVGTLSSGYYPINATNVTATATMNIGTAGWYTGGDSKSSKLAASRQVGKMAAAVFSVSGATVNCSTAGYVPSGAVGTVDSATFANEATSGTTYTDYSSSAPVLKSGDFLYINAGYTPARKISLAKLVPDAADVGAAETSANILTGHSAYNIDGKIVAGSMVVYDGTYTVT